MAFRHVGFRTDQDIPAVLLENIGDFVHPFRIDQKFVGSQRIKCRVDMHGVSVVNLYFLYSIFISQVALQPIEPKTIAAAALGSENAPTALDHIRGIKKGFELSGDSPHRLTFHRRNKIMAVRIGTQLWSGS